MMGSYINNMLATEIGYCYDCSYINNMLATEIGYCYDGFSNIHACILLPTHHSYYTQ